MTSGRNVPSYSTLSPELFSGVFETSPVSLVIVDTTGTVTHVNERIGGLLEMPSEILVGLNAFDDHWKPQDGCGQPLPVGKNPFKKALDGVSTEGQDLSILLPDGRRIYFRVNCSPVYNEEGTIIAAVGAFEDQTATTLREQELEAKNRQLGSLASVLSHDLRNPLSIARGYLDLAQETGDNTHLARVEDAHERMEELIDNLLLLARRGEAIGPREVVSLATSAQMAWATVATGEATVTIDDGLDAVYADRIRLQQLFENLFRNTVEHGGKAAHIVVSPLDTEDGFVVADDGPGLPDVDERTPLDTYLDATEEVAGLGLKIVQAVSEAHGWRAFVAPRPDGGVQFEFLVGDAAVV